MLYHCLRSGAILLCQVPRVRLRRRARRWTRKVFVSTSCRLRPRGLRVRSLGRAPRIFGLWRCALHVPFRLAVGFSTIPNLGVFQMGYHGSSLTSWRVARNSFLRVEPVRRGAFAALRCTPLSRAVLSPSITPPALGHGQLAFAFGLTALALFAGRPSSFGTGLLSWPRNLGLTLRLFGFPRVWSPFGSTFGSACDVSALPTGLRRRPLIRRGGNESCFGSDGWWW
mmetsp:Transcript_3096/g.8992  ORF Transcript_3096/g.8992 Transcript_3096/m.8992 type:complete len:226 (-) Transcript_3096:1872-2549(-)